MNPEFEQVMIGIVNARLADKDCVEKGTLNPQTPNQRLEWAFFL